MSEPFVPTRRVVTGHDAAGVAQVLSDGPAPNVRSNRPGVSSTLIWATFETPAEIALGTAAPDLGLRTMGTQPPPRGTRFTVNDYPPGGGGAMHRTETLDYVIVMAGRIEMRMDEGSVTLHAGDVLVQRGTNHHWINTGDVNARVAFVLIDAEPLGIGHPRDGGAYVPQEKS